MDPDEHIENIARERREHLKEKCHEAHLNGEGWRVSVSAIHWDGCNATWQWFCWRRVRCPSTLAPSSRPPGTDSAATVARR